MTPGRPGGQPTRSVTGVTPRCRSAVAPKSLETGDRKSRWRDAFEEALGNGEESSFDCKSFRHFAVRYLQEEGRDRLAPTTLADAFSYLRVDGPLIRVFGGPPVNEIDLVALREWWQEEVVEGGKAKATGMNG